MAATALVLAATVTPGSRTGAPVICLRCGELWLVDAFWNVVLFIPLGAALGGLGWKPIRALIAASALSAAIEVAQLTIVPGRFASPADWATNSLGAALGSTIALSWRHWIRPVSPERALRFGQRWALCLVVAFTLAGLMLKPSVPHSEWFGQWAPALGQFDRFLGKVDSASARGLALPAGRIGDSEPFWRRYEDGGIGLAAVVRAGGPTASTAPIVSIFDREERKIALLGQRGNGLVFEPRLAAEDWGARPIAVELQGAFDSQIARPLPVSGSLKGGRIRLEIAGSEPRTAGLDLNPAMVSIPLLPFRVGAVTPFIGRAVAALLLALAAVPLGFFVSWGSLGAVTLPARLLPFLAFAVPLLPIPFGLPVASPWLWIGGLGGAGAGLLIGRWQQR